MNFLTALKNRKAEGHFPVIPDIKCFSPKDGDLMKGRDPVSIARGLADAGACVLSVVTESSEFHGSMDLLREICGAVDVPVLRKDFIDTAGDLEATRDAGASAVLLMYSCLGRERLEALYAEAIRLGLVPFVETHTGEELAWADALGADLVGINNRDILQLERDDGDVRRSEDLMRFRPTNAFLVVESGLRNGADTRRAARCGADAALIGTAILRDPDPAAMYRALTRPCGLKICGLMDHEGIRLCHRHHVDLLGFVTDYPVPVPWNLSGAGAASLLADAKNTAPYAETCLVTGGRPEKVISLAKDLRPDHVQLHYAETAAETAKICDALLPEGIRVIRSIPRDPAQRRQMFDSTDLPAIAEKLSRAGVYALLLDSRDAANASVGGGSILDQVSAQTILRMRQVFHGPILLGGGLTAGNLPDAIHSCRPDAVDIMTGVETSPGRKSDRLLQEITGVLEAL